MLRAGADTGDGGAGFRAIDSLARWHQPRNFLAAARDRDFFALLNQIEQLAEFVLGLEGANLMLGILGTIQYS